MHGFEKKWCTNKGKGTLAIERTRRSAIATSSLQSPHKQLQEMGIFCNLDDSNEWCWYKYSFERTRETDHRVFLRIWMYFRTHLYMYTPDVAQLPRPVYGTALGQFWLYLASMFSKSEIQMVLSFGSEHKWSSDDTKLWISIIVKLWWYVALDVQKGECLIILSLGSQSNWSSDNA